MKKKKIVTLSKPKPVLDIQKMRLSFSAVQSYLRCGQQYKFSYIEEKKAIPGIALLEGSSHHTAFEMNNRNKMEHSTDLKANELTDKFMSTLREKVGKEEKVDWEDENEDNLFRRARVWHENYINDVAPKINPDIIEEKYEMDMEMGGIEFKMVGIVDLGYSKRVSDYKTTSSYGFTNKKKEVNTDLQLSYYSLMTKRKNVEYICMVKKATPEIGILQSTRSEGQIKWALQVAKSVAQAIKNNDFPMTNPNNWHCSEKYCGYWKLCRGKYERN